MGSGQYSIDSYRRRARAKQATGRSTFDYSDRISSGQIAAAVNPLLDPKRTCGPTSPFAGQVIREVVVSAEHPRPTPIAVILDVTGSNYQSAKIVHSKLPQLFGLLQRKGYVEDPEINFCAIGDANSDRVPLQIGAFESDNRIDAQLEALYLEGGGGGQVHETYELAAYFLARHTHLEPLEQQGRKGYAIFIGDEMPYDMVRSSQVRHLIGDKLEADIPTTQIFTELQEKFEVFFLFQKQGSYSESQILPAWRKLLGERALVLDDPAAVCEFIAGMLVVFEGGLSSDEAEADLIASGADLNAIRAAGKALATVSGSAGRAVATSDGSLPDDLSTDGSTRL